LRKRRRALCSPSHIRRITSGYSSINASRFHMLPHVPLLGLESPSSSRTRRISLQLCSSADANPSPSWQGKKRSRSLRRDDPRRLHCFPVSVLHVKYLGLIKWLAILYQCWFYANWIKHEHEKMILQGQFICWFTLYLQHTNNSNSNNLMYKVSRLNTTRIKTVTMWHASRANKSSDKMRSSSIKLSAHWQIRQIPCARSMYRWRPGCIFVLRQCAFARTLWYFMRISLYVYYYVQQSGRMGISLNFAHVKRNV
jgi:hypothetical protein